MRAFVLSMCFCALASSLALAQSAEPRFEAGVHFVHASLGALDASDSGVSLAFAWRPTALLGAEAEWGFYPQDAPGDIAFSSSRVEGLFGVTVGPRLDRVRPFAKGRFGFVTFNEAPQPIACIAIFPPPLACVLAAGDTVPAFDIGGGVEIYPSAGTFVRFDLSDRVLRYPGLVFENAGGGDAYVRQGFRFAVGGGVRF